jgi:hypothetical protein
MQATVPFREYTLKGEIDTSLYPAIKHKPVISAILRIPDAVPEGTKVPVVVDYSMRLFGNRLFPDEELWKAMASAGIGVVYYDPLALQPDNGASLTDCLIGLANKGNWRQPADWGTLVAWSWGVSRLIDYFGQSGSPADASRVAVIASPFFGKAALVDLAYDTRVTAAYPAASGMMMRGAAPRRNGAGNATGVAGYHRLAGNAMLYTGTADGTLTTLCAPRPVFNGNGERDAASGYNAFKELLLKSWKK